MISKRKNINSEILIIGLFLLGGITLHFLIGNFTKSISIYADELRYFTIARSMYMGDGLTIRGAATSFQKIAYSLVLAPFFAIKDGVLRMKVLNLVNSIVVVSSIIPVWLICNELKLKKRTKIIIAVFVVLWPETVSSMTFMAENLYWPLFFTFILILLYNERKRSRINAAVAAFICYLGYMTKEIFLALFISCVLFQALCAMYQYWINRKENIKTNIIRERIIFILIFMGVFVSMHVILKLTIFHGLGNSYDQMGITAISLPYNFLYLFYAFFYYIAAILVVMLVIPFAYSLSCVNLLTPACKKLLTFIISFFLTASFTIAYTISVREDLGQVAPRMHFRYLAPGFIIMLAVFLCTAESVHSFTEKRIKERFKIIIAGMTIFSCVLFKGVAPGSPVDQNSLRWYINIVERFNILAPSNNGGKVFYLGIVVINIIVITFVILFYFLQQRHIKISCSLFIMALLLTCVESDRYSVQMVKNELEADSGSIEEALLINEYFESIEDDIDILYFTDADTINKTSKYLDTYLDRTDGLYYVDDTFLESVAGKEYPIKEISLKESIWDTVYPKTDKIDYVIVENSDFPPQISIQNCEKIEEISGELYSVYKNNCPNVIAADYSQDYCYTGTDMMIFFSGNQYNALNYVLSGVSTKEDGFSWTDGDVMHVEIPATIPSGNVNISINVIGTFNGVQRYSVNTAGGIVSGQLDGPGIINFTSEIRDGNITFDLECNDAQVVNEVVPENSDMRKVAFQINTIKISPNS